MCNAKTDLATVQFIGNNKQYYKQLKLNGSQLAKMKNSIPDMSLP